MRHWIAGCCVGVWFVSTCLAQNAGESPSPAWIWQAQPNRSSFDSQSPELSFRTTFDLSSHVTRATLRYAAQYTAATITLNERVLAEVEA